MDSSRMTAATIYMVCVVKLEHLKKKKNYISFHKIFSQSIPPEFHYPRQPYRSCVPQASFHVFVTD